MQRRTDFSKWHYLNGEAFGASKVRSLIELTNYDV
jgi:hypothetical protein